LSALERVETLSKGVDEKSKQIVTYLARERHARIKELTDLICASSDMEVLMRIREIINPKAQEITGKPAIKFERSKIDPLTGEKIVFNWWINEELTDSAHDDFVDVMDEKGILRIVVALPPQEKNAEVKVNGSLLVISGKEYYKEVPLFCNVEKKADVTLNNGVLEIKLSKVG
jgi:HSP20 family molecular chaperone IbpA